MNFDNKKEIEMIHPLTGRKISVSENKYLEYRKAVNSFWMRHRRSFTCGVKHYSMAVKLCPMNCSICRFQLDNTCVSLDEIMEETAGDKYRDSALIDYNTPDVIYEKEQLYRKLHELIDHCSETDKTICQLYMDGYNLSEISEIMHIDKSSVGRHFKTITERFAEKLKEFI